MNQPFEWPEMPPLDIRRVSDLIQILWLEMTRKAEREAEKDAQMMIPPGSPRDYGRRWQFTVGAELGDKVIEILKEYDQGRTYQIKFLQGELMRLVSTRPMVWIGDNPPKDVKP